MLMGRFPTALMQYKHFLCLYNLHGMDVRGLNVADGTTVLHVAYSTVKVGHGLIPK